MNRLILIVALFLSLRQVAEAQTFDYDFENDMQGWTCGFADYNIGDSLAWGLTFRHDTMPTLTNNHGIILSGQNLSDNLFFYCKKYLTGLSPNSTYLIFFSADLVTRDCDSCIGGSDLMFKAGATHIEPNSFPDSTSGLMLMNINKDDQANPGFDMDTLGLVRHPFPDMNYHLITLSNSSHPFTFHTDANGNAWLIIGAESMFEVFAEFLVAELSVEFVDVTGIDEGEIAKEVLLFPNPSAGKMMIDESVQLPARLVIFDGNGKNVRISVLRDRMIETSGLSEGLYYLRINSLSGVYRGKFVVNK